MGKSSYRRIDIHDFYCMGCGRKVFECVRPRARKREKFHRKKLYCPWCKVTANCIECRNDEDVFEFKTSYENGEFQEEYELSLKECEAND